MYPQLVAHRPEQGYTNATTDEHRNGLLFNESEYLPHRVEQLWTYGNSALVEAPGIEPGSENLTTLLLRA
jgi:hypothetical protein